MRYLGSLDGFDSRISNADFYAKADIPDLIGFSQENNGNKIRTPHSLPNPHPTPDHPDNSSSDWMEGLQIGQAKKSASPSRVRGFEKAIAPALHWPTAKPRF